MNKNMFIIMPIILLALFRLNMLELLTGDNFKARLTSTELVKKMK